MPRCTRSRPGYSSSLSCGRPFSCHPRLVLLPLFLTRCLLLRDGGTTWTFARARVRVRALTTHGKSATMPEPPISANIHQTLDVHLNALAQIAFDFALRLKDRANTTQLFFAQIADTRV